jgi:hypothetical protein
MLRYFLFVCALVMLMAPSWAQIYEDKYEEMVGPMDRAGNQSIEMYADVPAAGAEEDAMPQDVRYQNMTVPMNEANENHFGAGKGYRTVAESDGEVR